MYEYSKDKIDVGLSCDLHVNGYWKFTSNLMNKNTVKNQFNFQNTDLWAQ